MKQRKKIVLIFTIFVAMIVNSAFNTPLYAQNKKMFRIKTMYNSFSAYDEQNNLYKSTNEFVFLFSKYHILCDDVLNDTNIVMLITSKDVLKERKKNTTTTVFDGFDASDLESMKVVVIKKNNLIEVTVSKKDLLKTFYVIDISHYIKNIQPK
jgi:hypothetical protein